MRVAVGPIRTSRSLRIFKSTGATATFSLRSFSPAEASVWVTCISGLFALGAAAASSGTAGVAVWPLEV